MKKKKKEVLDWIKKTSDHFDMQIKISELKGRLNVKIGVLDECWPSSPLRRVCVTCV